MKKVWEVMVRTSTHSGGFENLAASFPTREEARVFMLRDRAEHEKAWAAWPRQADVQWYSVLVEYDQYGNRTVLEQGDVAVAFAEGDS